MSRTKAEMQQSDFIQSKEEHYKENRADSLWADPGILIPLLLLLQLLLLLLQLLQLQLLLHCYNYYNYK